MLMPITKNQQPYNPQSQKLKQSLKKLHDLIQRLQTNKFITSAQALQICQKIQAVLFQQLRYVGKYRITYIHWLIQLYATRFGKAWKAQDLCNMILNEQIASLNVSVDTMLRLSYVLYIQKRYQSSIDRLETVYHLVHKKPQLSYKIEEYYQKFFLGFKDQNLVKGLKAQQIDKNYQKALDYYSKQFKQFSSRNQQINQNKYFAGKSVLQIARIFPNRKFNGIQLQKCKEYIEKLQVQTAMQLDYGGSLNDRYLFRKKYLLSIVSYQQKTKQSINQFEQKKVLNSKIIIAHFKLLKALKYKNFDQKTEEQLKDLDFTLLQGKIKKNFLADSFISDEWQIINHIQKIINVKHQIKIQMAWTLLKLKTKDFKQQIQDECDPFFTGSQMYLVHSLTSTLMSPQDLRYFSFKKSQMQKKQLKLYFRNKEAQIQDPQNYYDISDVNFTDNRNWDKVWDMGFPVSQCFSLKLNKMISDQFIFYVPQKSMYRQWKLLFQAYENIERQNIIQVQKTEGQTSSQVYPENVQKKKKKKLFGIF